MKVISILCLLALTLFASEENPEKELLGTWQAIVMNEGGEETSFEGDDPFFFIFGKHNTITMRAEGDEEEMQYSIRGNSILVDGEYVRFSITSDDTLRLEPVEDDYTEYMLLVRIEQ